MERKGTLKMPHKAKQMEHSTEKPDQKYAWQVYQSGFHSDMITLSTNSNMDHANLFITSYQYRLWRLDFVERKEGRHRKILVGWRLQGEPRTPANSQSCLILTRGIKIIGIQK